MSLKIERSGVRYRFDLGEVDLDPEQARRANMRLAEILAIAPPGASAVGQLQKQDRCYRSVVDVRSPYRCFHEEAVAVEPATALRRVIEKVEDQIHAWRYGRGQKGSAGQATYFSRHQTQG